MVTFGELKIVDTPEKYFYRSSVSPNANCRNANLLKYLCSSARCCLPYLAHISPIAIPKEASSDIKPKRGMAPERFCPAKNGTAVSSRA